jgi:hypothetical protein
MEDAYAATWTAYRRMRKFRVYALIAFLTGPFVMIPMLGFLLRFATFQFLLNLKTLPLLIECALLLAVGYCERMQYKWECPRCGKAFGRLHEECQHCALPLWARADDCDLNVDSSGVMDQPKPRV